MSIVAGPMTAITMVMAMASIGLMMMAVTMSITTTIDRSVDTEGRGAGGQVVV